MSSEVTVQVPALGALMNWVVDGTRELGRCGSVPPRMVMSGSRTNAYQNCACTASISERICRLNRVISGKGMHLQKTVLHRTLLGLSIKIRTH